MSLRDELADSLWRLAPSIYEMADCNSIASALIADGWTKPAPCVMTHTPPMDFAQCETHDETFPLGETCRFHERDMVEVLFEAADEQRMRAVRAELELERAARALARIRNLADCQQTVGASEIFDAIRGDL